MKKFNRVLLHPIKTPVKKLIASAMAIDYHMGNYKEVVWLVGDGRSGTTWVSSLISFEKKYREMFEPFHPKLATGMEEFSFCVL